MAFASIALPLKRESMMSSTAITGPSATDSPATIIERRSRTFDTDSVFNP